jgi:hypothetical protein
MITIGFSSHHVEALPYIHQEMEGHQVIVLEEPPSPHFPEMLQGAISNENYVLELDSGFPEFDRQMCALLKELHREGKRIMQVEPYLETLLQIHEGLASGKTAEEIRQRPEFQEVYEAEKRATGALISYYSVSTSEAFSAVVEAVKVFARADALRLTIRERLRAEAISALHRPGERMYVEAGYIHYPIYRYLRQEMGKTPRIKVVYLLTPAIKRLGGKRRNMGPGDILTLHYALHNNVREEMANLLAARSLVYIKLVEKEELLPGKSLTPHIEDEIQVNRQVDRLDFNQCGELFQQIRFSKRQQAVERAKEYMGKELGMRKKV